MRGQTIGFVRIKVTVHYTPKIYFVGVYWNQPVSWSVGWLVGRAGKCYSVVIDVQDAIFSHVNLVIAELWPLEF